MSWSITLAAKTKAGALEHIRNQPPHVPDLAKNLTAKAVELLPEPPAGMAIQIASSGHVDERWGNVNLDVKFVQLVD